MHTLSQPQDLMVVDEPQDGVEEVGPWELTKLKPLHRDVASLVAQGHRNIDVARMLNITPQYVSMLLRQPLVKAYIGEMNEVVGARLEAMFEQSVNVMADVMKDGSHGDKIKAARLQLEATKRIGRPDPLAGMLSPDLDRLEKLAERLIGLQSGIRQGGTFNEAGEEFVDA